MAASVLFWAGLAQAQLSAPAPMDPNAVGQPQPVQQAPQTETQQTLQQSESEDSGRGLEFFYANGGVNATYVGMDAVSSSNFAVSRTSHLGPGFDLGLGLRLLIITIGPRLRFQPLSSFDMWQIDGEAALHIPISSLDIWFGAHGGYAFATSLADLDGVKVHGADVGIDVGVDYYLTKFFSVGADGSASMFFLTRPAIAPNPGTQAAAAAEAPYVTNGSSVGLGLLLGARAGLHF
ncbi:MAG: hypothetical protein ABI551_17650 [Polyangiaceae bacterium]